MKHLWGLSGKNGLPGIAGHRASIDTELIIGEIYPGRRKATLKDWIEAIAFGILYMGIIYGLIIVIAK